MGESDDVLARMTAELAELDKRREDLQAFLGTTKYAALSDLSRELLRRQGWAMDDYSRILGRHIAGWGQ